ncbi:hypothetical protein BY458DRAFT_482279 [Sporodiniella umbellata]|nr:hypothetical protein BY458DRAFT_482279 [Sporodiniella umbellata]
MCAAPATEEEYASQIIEEEEDLFFDQDSEEEDSEDLGDLVREENEDSIKKRLAGPSTNKAGLNKTDKDKINMVIYEASKGSAFFENERKKDEMVTKRINRILAKYEYIKNQDLSFEKRIVDTMIHDLEQTRDLSQCVCHVDMDAFYASVEELENPTLRSQPMAVGGMSMLCTSNYEARKFGVRSGMPGFIALKLCPQLKMIPLHFPKYTNASNKVREVFSRYDPNFMPMSLDEAYLNLTECLKKEPHLTPYELVQRIRKEIFDSTQLTASAGLRKPYPKKKKDNEDDATNVFFFFKKGIACNKMLAKICSDIDKPNGQYYLPIDKNSIMNFVKDLQVRQLPGVGRVTERVLECLGVNTCGDIYPKRALLYKLLSPISFQFLLKCHLGLGTTIFDTETERKSIGVERTFSSMSNPDRLYEKLHELCKALEADAEKACIMGRNVSIKIKFTSFEVRIRSKTMPNYIWSAKHIETVAKQLLSKEMPMDLRLMGVRLSNLKARGSNDESVLKYFTKAPLPEKLEEAAPRDNESYEILICPICSCQFKLNNIQFNMHVDECLNRVELKTILESDKRSLSISLDYVNASSSRNKKTKRSSKPNGKSLFDYYPPSST